MTMKTTRKQILVGFIGPWLASATSLRRTTSSASSSTVTAQTREWSQCVELSMTAEECQELVERDSQIPNLEVNIVKDGTQESSLPYFQVPIRTNVYGEVSCRPALVTYPFNWDPLVGDSYEIPPMDCAGLGAVECCALFQNHVTELDVHGHLLQCHVEQEPLVPALDSQQQVVYQTWVWNATTQDCVAQSLTAEQVRQQDHALQMALESTQEAIASDIMAQGTASCDQLQSLSHLLLINTRTIPTNYQLQSKLQQLPRQCQQEPEKDWHTVQDLTPDVFTLLKEIQVLLKGASLKSSLVQTVNIQASRDGQHVLSVPTLGQTLAFSIDSFQDNNNNNEEEEEEIVEHGISEELCVIDPSCAMDSLIMLDPNEDACVEDPTYALLNATHASVLLLERLVDSGELTSDVRTKFHYSVCSPKNQTASTITFTWRGECLVASYSYFGMGTHSSDDDVEFGLDATTCTSGMHLRQLVSDQKDDDDSQQCKTFTLELQGNVPSTSGASITLTFQDKEAFVTLPVEGPDCSFCIISD